MNFTLSIEEEVLQAARRRAAALGTSLNQLVRDYLQQLAGNQDAHADAAQFERLSRLAKGNSREWKFDREQLHARNVPAKPK